MADKNKRAELHRSIQADKEIENILRTTGIVTQIEFEEFIKMNKQLQKKYERKE